MAGLGAAAGFIYLIAIFALLILGILLPVFVFRIYQESIKTNKLLQQILSCILNPENASNTIPNPEKIRQLQQSYRGRKNNQTDPAKIVKIIVDGKNTDNLIGLCNCGKRFTYPKQKVGTNAICPGCKQQVILRPEKFGEPNRNPKGC